MTVTLLVGVAGFIGYNSAHGLLLSSSLDKAGNDINIRSTNLQATFDGLQSDIAFLSSTPPIQGIIRAKDNNGIDPQEETDYDVWTARLETIFEAIIKAKSTYMQIRYIDENGNEMVRVDFDGVTATKVAKEDLQNKKHRGYFVEAMRKSQGDVYVSAIDLNREQGQVEKPFKPTVRYAMPIFDSHNQRRGIIIANVLVQKFIDLFFESKDKNTQLFLVNNEGFYLMHPDKEKEWGGPSDLDTGENLNKDMPDGSRILSGSSDIIQQEDRVVAYVPIFPYGDDKDRFMVAVSRIDNESIFFPTLKLRNQVLLVGMVSILFAIGLGFFISRRITKPLEKLSKTVSDISKGNFNVKIEKTVKIDEINQLADSLSRIMKTMKVAVLRMRESGSSSVKKKSPSKRKSKNVDEQIVEDKEKTVEEK